MVNDKKNGEKANKRATNKNKLLKKIHVCWNYGAYQIWAQNYGQLGFLMGRTVKSYLMVKQKIGRVKENIYKGKAKLPAKELLE